MEFHEVSMVVLYPNTGKYRLGEAIRYGFDVDNNAVCWCCERTQSLSASSIWGQ